MCVAREVQIGRTLFKKVCRREGIEGWPASRNRTVRKKSDGPLRPLRWEDEAPPGVACAGSGSGGCSSSAAPWEATVDGSPQGGGWDVGVEANFGRAWPSSDEAPAGFMAVLDDGLPSVSWAGDDVWGGSGAGEPFGDECAFDGQRPPGALGAATAAAAQRNRDDVSAAAASLPAGNVNDGLLGAEGQDEREDQDLRGVLSRLA